MQQQGLCHINLKENAGHALRQRQGRKLALNTGRPSNIKECRCTAWKHVPHIPLYTSSQRSRKKETSPGKRTNPPSGLRAMSPDSNNKKFWILTRLQVDGIHLVILSIKYKYLALNTCKHIFMVRENGDDAIWHAPPRSISAR